MSTALFIIGALTALGCGFNIVSVSKSTWQHEAIWVLGGSVGAVMMIVAALISNGGIG